MWKEIATFLIGMLQGLGSFWNGFIERYQEKHMKLETKELEFLSLLLDQRNKRLLIIEDINMRLSISIREYNLMTSKLIDLKLIYIVSDYCRLTSRGVRVLRRVIK